MGFFNKFTADYIAYLESLIDPSAGPGGKSPYDDIQDASILLALSGGSPGIGGSLQQDFGLYW